MNRRKTVVVILSLSAVAGLVVAGLWLAGRGDDGSAEAEEDSSADSRMTASAEGLSARERLIATPEELLEEPEPDEAGDQDAEDEPEAEAEGDDAVEEAAVDAFDALTDKWMEPATARVDLKAIAAFSEAFRKVPEARRDECIHRALNLIPDENVMLLAGVLMDKSMPKEIVETVFNDVLNRDEDVKKPILQEIFKDKTHPCWADAAWILDVTDELPGKSVP